MFNITKTTVECYKIRHSTTEYWADITIDAHERGGRIQIASDFGSWQNYWNNAGKSFKKFLIGLDIYYVAGKFGCSKWFDFDKTIKSYKLMVIEQRKDKSITPAHARNCYNEIKYIESNCSENIDDFVNQMYNTGHLMKLFDGCPDVHYDVEPGFRRFWDEIWPEFIKQLKDESSSRDTESVGDDRPAVS